ncbi:ABC transporter permease [Bacillus weihaiensis]|uniref:ABC transporter permease n=1 Tax=Bacillus weihaiensis TaxID=1547283 RepID=UPI0023549C3A|nr:ABC transporter permease [Bacillus weihaiensis]
MTIFSFTLKSLKGRKTSSLFLIISIAIAVALTCSVLLISSGVEDGIKKQAESYDLIVGAEGSPLQLTLNSLMYVDTPTGNVSYELYESLVKDDKVLKAIPLALGDSYKGRSIVGTNLEFFEPFREGLPDRFTLKEGEWFAKSGEVVLGSQLAKDADLRIGDEFHGNHGVGNHALEHEDYSYEVVGILNSTGTADDQAIFTPIESVWEVHDHEGDDSSSEEHEDEKEITALLIKPEQLGLAPLIKNEIEAFADVQAVYPVTVLRQLLDTFTSGTAIAMILVGVALFMAMLFIVFAILSSVNQRKKETEILKALGVSRSKVLLNLLLEQIILSFIGTSIGGVLTVITYFIVKEYSFATLGLMLTNEAINFSLILNLVLLFFLCLLVSVGSTLVTNRQLNKKL